jgi:CDP-diglyceride synthetase
LVTFLAGIVIVAFVDGLIPVLALLSATENVPNPINDTFAYLFGVSFGKHRLFERISPKKSWEGFFGGAFMAIAFICIYTKTLTSIRRLLSKWQ